jgi:EmrB/QacA subfamily drug resistance transporter
MGSTDSKTYRNTILFIICLATTLIPFMGSALNLAMPIIAHDFSLNAISLSWVISIFLLSSAILPIPFSKLADRVGRKKIFITGIIVFIISTILCGLANSGFILIVGRLFQGIGASMMFATNMAILTSIFPANERGKALGINTAVVYISLSSGPFIGGLLTHYFGWRSIFYVTSAVGLLVLLGLSLFVKEEWKEPDQKSFDWIGTILYGLGLSTLMYGFSNLPAFQSALLMIIGTILLITFVRYEKNLDFPVMHVRLFWENKVFGFASSASLINYAATYAITFLLSLYLQYIKGFDSQHAGFLLIIQPLVMAIVSPLAGRWSDKTDARYLATGGMAIIVISLLLMLMLNPTTSLTLIIAISVIMGIGFGLFSSPNVNVIMGSIEKKHLGMASATTNTMRLTGQAMSMGITMMVISMVVGKVKITPDVLPQFMSALHTIFIVMAALCCLAVYTSWHGTQVKK